ncbi:MAG: hypothetical protein D6715_03535 [Calditrichaeota bacterium]|nr:MAG: hypothetical protein D6715_03535 [Calditrichota bacterium]
MEFFISFLNTILPLLYLVCTYLYALVFFRGEPGAERRSGPFLRVTVLLHFIEVVLRGFYYHHFPLATVFEAATVLALAIALIYLYIEARLGIKTTGYFILILVTFIQLFSSAFINFVKEIPEVLHSPLFIFHTSFAILGYASLAVSAIYGLMYLLLFYDIKSSRFGVIYSRLPSLEVLNEMNYRAAVLGFVFLTFAIVLGAVWSNVLYSSLINLDPKVLIASLTWVIYGVEILGKRFLGWAGKRLAYLSLSGFVVILFSMLAVNLMLTSFHQFK